MWFMRNSIKSKSEKSLYAFRGKWVKDLQVSPFLPTSGCTYTFESSDPATNDMLELMLVLRGQGKPTIISRVTSVAPSLQLSTATMTENVWFLIRWWYSPMSSWVVFRMLSLAFRILLIKRPKNIFTCPEPPATSIGQRAGVVEK